MHLDNPNCVILYHKYVTFCLKKKHFEFQILINTVLNKNNMNIIRLHTIIPVLNAVYLIEKTMQYKRVRSILYGY